MKFKRFFVSCVRNKIFLTTKWRKNSKQKREGRVEEEKIERTLYGELDLARRNQLVGSEWSRSFKISTSIFCLLVDEIRIYMRILY